MRQGRVVARPIVRTYITKTISPSGAGKIHARISSPSYDVDLRGTGNTVQRAVDEALQRLPRDPRITKSRTRHRSK